MADIYTVLANSLRKRNIQDPAVREQVYVQARIALIRKLWAHRPRLSNRQIEDTMAVFDLAVAFVESDVTPTLPATRRRDRERDEAARRFRERQLANLDFDFTESDIDAEADPGAGAHLAYRSHVRQAAARITQWNDMMVQEIDPVSIAALAFVPEAALEPASEYREERDWTVRPPGALRETVLVKPPVSIPSEPRRERRPSSTIRLLRTFFPQEVPAGDGTIAPGRMEALLRRIVLLFERLSVWLYEASVAAERARRQKTTPRVFIKPPRADEMTARRRRIRRRLFNRVLPPAAAFATVGAIVWVSNSFGPAIMEKLEHGFTVKEEAQEQTPPIPGTENIEAEAEKGIAAAPEPDIILFRGEDAKAFVANEAHPIELLGDDKEHYVRISSSPKQSADARLVVPPDIADRLAGKSAHFIVTARSATTDGAGTVRFAYQAGDETSPFEAQPLGEEYRRLEMVWTVPGGASLGQHALLIEPGLLGGGNAVDIKAVEIYFAR